MTPYRDTVYAPLIQAHLDNNHPHAATKIYNRLKTRLANINRSPSAKIRKLVKANDP